jgi:hypothetical protein
MAGAFEGLNNTFGNLMQMLLAIKQMQAQKESQDASIQRSGASTIMDALVKLGTTPEGFNKALNMFSQAHNLDPQAVRGMFNQGQEQPLGGQQQMPSQAPQNVTQDPLMNIIQGVQGSNVQVPFAPEAQQPQVQQPAEQQVPTGVPQGESLLLKSLKKMATPEVTKSLGLPDDFITSFEGQQPIKPDITQTYEQTKNNFQMVYGFDPQTMIGGEGKKDFAKMFQEQWKQDLADYKDALKDYNTGVKDVWNKVASGVIKDKEMQKKFQLAIEEAGITSRIQLQKELIMNGVTNQQAVNRLVLSSGLSEGKEKRMTDYQAKVSEAKEKRLTEHKAKIEQGKEKNKETIKNMTLRNQITGEIRIVPYNAKLTQRLGSQWEPLTGAEEAAYQERGQRVKAEAAISGKQPAKPALKGRPEIQAIIDAEKKKKGYSAGSLRKQLKEQFPSENITNYNW